MGLAFFYLYETTDDGVSDFERIVTLYMHKYTVP